jgi:hypothetical protein
MGVSITETSIKMNSKTLQEYLDRYGSLVADRARQVGETFAKNGPYRRAAAAPRGYPDRRGVLRCPDCGARLRENAGGEGGFLSRKGLERSRKRCPAEIVVEQGADGNPVTRLCGAPLWRYAEGQAVWAPADYVHKHVRGVFDYHAISVGNPEFCCRTRPCQSPPENLPEFSRSGGVWSLPIGRPPSQARKPPDDRPQGCTPYTRNFRWNTVSPQVA